LGQLLSVEATKNLRAWLFVLKMGVALHFLLVSGLVLIIVVAVVAVVAVVVVVVVISI